jgi:rhodanese-related sulfurtransferase
MRITRLSTALLTLLLAAILLAGCGASSASDRAAAPTANSGGALAADLPPEVSIEEAHELYETGVFVLDVREQDEWNQVHIPNTTLIPLGQLAERANELPKGQPIVVICRSGNRSAQGRDILLQAGFTSVTSVAGGMNAWASAGFPTTTGP